MVTGIGQYETNLVALTQSAQGTSGVVKPDVGDAQALRDRLGDTVEISDEAYALLESKMQEYKGMAPEDLSEDQKDELKGILSDTLGISEDEVEELAEKLAQGPPPPPPGGGAEGGGEGGEGGPQGQGGPPQGGPGGSGGPGAGRGSGEAGASESDSSSTDETLIDNLEKEIEKLEKEIEKLSAKAGGDEEAQKELQLKRADLALKQSQLTELESQQAEA